MNRTEEHRHKLSLTREYMARHALDAVAISRQASFAWLTCGGDNHVGIATEAGVGTVGVTADKTYLVASNIEAPRLAAEEVNGLGMEVCSFPWHKPAERDAILSDIVAGGTAASDDGSPGTRPLGGDFAELRYSLTQPEIDRYRWLGRNCSLVVEAACRRASPQQTEWELAAAISEGCFKAEITPIVLLVAADERINRFRHPIPTDTRAKRALMAVLCGRRWGLIVSLTRLVHFDPLSDELKARHQAVCRVDAAFIAGTVIGRSTGEVFRNAVEVYRETGFADEWLLHHQGGPTGYASRDYKPTPDETRLVLPNQAFAWNPSISGTKSEDTILATPDGPEILSRAHEWPMLTVDYAGKVLSRPDVLVK